MIGCPSCSLPFKTMNAVRIHARCHGMTSEDVYLAFNGPRPTCACGCGAYTKFGGIVVGYTKFRPGHQSRVHNNWGHNPKALEKSHQYRREAIECGEFVIWNKGETKQTNEALVRQGQTFRERITDETRKKLSERMRENRLSGIVPTLSGSSHSQWKGGTSTLGQLARSYVFNAWSKPKMMAANYTCQVCGRREQLNVHHDGERFASILHKAVELFGDVTDDTTFEQKSLMCEWIADYHIKNDVSGQVLCETCHDEVHASD